MSHAFDAFGDSYEDVVQSSIDFAGLRHSFFLDAKISELATLFRHRFGARRPALLDVGCGVGALHAGLAPLVSRLAGCDPSEISLAKARRQHPDVAYRRNQGGAIPFAPESFDVTLAVCVFHHVDEGERAELVDSMRRATRPGGLVILVEHNPWNPLTRLAVARCPIDHDAVLLRAGSARRLLARGGLRGVGSHAFLLLPTAARIARRIEAAFRQLPLGAQYMAYGTV